MQTICVFSNEPSKSIIMDSIHAVHASKTYALHIVEM